MWTNKSKTTGSSTLKAKILSKVETGYLVTPDETQILVGQEEMETLIYQEEREFWEKKGKEVSS